MYILKVIVPEHSNCEVVIQALGQGEDLAKRTVVQVVEAVNKAIGSEDTVAVQRIYSSDTVLTFMTNTTNYIKNIK